MSFCNLPLFISYQIYESLDYNDRKSLAETNKSNNQYFKYIKNVDASCKKIVDFILENYQIAESSHELDNLKNIFSFSVRFILLGETHCQEEHRYLNGHFIRIIWNVNSVLQVEGGKRSLDHARQNQTSFCKYIPKEITETAESWDLPDDNDGWNTSHELFFYAKTVAISVKELLLLFDNKNKSNLSNLLSNFIEKFYSSDMYQIIPEISLLKESENSLSNIEIDRLIHTIYKNIINITLNCVDENLDRLFKIETSVTELRNAYLAAKVKDVVLSGKSGIFLTGSNHIQDPYVISYAKNINKMNHIPYLFLIPKPFITHDSIQKSFNRIFMNAKNETKETNTVLLNKIENKVEEPKSPEEHFNNMKNSLLSFDVDKIDMDLNHFGIWLYISKEILKYEKKRLEAIEN